MLNIQPREKQIVALNMLRSAWKQNNSFMLYAPVGFGKTAIAALITDGFVSRNTATESATVQPVIITAQWELMS